MEKNPKLTIVNKTDYSEDRVLAYRNKTSVEIFPIAKEVGFNDFAYTYTEIIAIGKKLEELIQKETLAWIREEVGKIKECQFIIFPIFFLQMWSRSQYIYYVSNESLIEDIVLKSYLELYLRSLNESRSHKFIQVIKKRMVELIKRKQQKPQ